MMTRWAGAALAAMMACGLASGAEAATFDVEGTYLDYNGRAGSFSFSNSSFNFEYYFQPSNSNDGRATISGAPSKLTYFSHGSSGVDIFATLPNASYTYDVFGVDPDLNTSQAGNKTFQITVSLSYTNGFVDSAYVDTYFGSLYFANASQDGEFRSTVDGTFVGPVPLPASAPMFGAALVVLGALGYSARRRAQ